MSVTNLSVTGIRSEGARITPVISPISGAVVGHVPRHTAQDVIGAVRSARVAQRAWAALSFTARARILISFHDLILDRREDLFRILQAESGKSWRDGFVEMFAVACEARYYAYNGDKWLRPHRVKSGIPLRDRSTVAYHPVGVVGIISPWNFPFILALADAIPALLAGNAIVLKPSSKTPLSALWGRDRLVEAGLPPDLFQVVTGPAGELGDALVAHSDYIMFTGSTETGREVAVKAARRLIPYSMELGGKNAILVLPGSDLRHAATVVIEGSFNNSGQVCISYERLYVHEQVYDDFKAELVRQVSQVRLGSQPGYDVDLGSMVDVNQARLADQQVQEALRKGAALVCGGGFRPDLGPAFYEPTILEGVTPEMQVYADETFGPVVALYKVASTEEAISRVNDSRYGLHHGVFCGDRREGQRIAAQLEAGSVCVNDGYMIWGVMDGPMGGLKESGMGRRHGPEGIRKFTEPQTIVTNVTPWQISSYETALAINKRLADVLVLLLRIWRHTPFVR